MPIDDCRYVRRRRSARATSRWPANAISTITAGSHTNGGNITHVFNRSGPNRPTIGVETTAMTTMLSSSSAPSAFQASGQAAAARAAMDGPRHRQRGEAGDDVEVPAGITHLIRHHAFAVGAVHQQFQREAKRLHANQRRQRQAVHQARAEARERHQRAEHARWHRQRQKRRRPQIETRQVPRLGRGPRRAQPRDRSDGSQRRPPPRGTGRFAEATAGEVDADDQQHRERDGHGHEAAGEELRREGDTD